MKAYSTDLREKMISAYESGEGTLDDIADRFAVGRCTVARILQRYRAGAGLAPKPHAGGYPASLDAKTLALLAQQIELQPDATLNELAQFLKKKARVQVHISTICRALQKLGLPRKKNVRGNRTSRSRPPSFSPPSGSTRSPALCVY